jgi:hypothetical protein
MKSPAWLSESGQNEGRVVEAGAGDFHIVFAQNDLFFAEMALFHSSFSFRGSIPGEASLVAGCCLRPT